MHLIIFYFIIYTVCIWDDLYGLKVSCISMGWTRSHKSHNMPCVFACWISTSKNLQLKRDDFRWSHASLFHPSILCNTPLNRRSPLPDDVFQMFADGEENTVVLVSLTPMTEYVINVYAVIGEESSEPLKGTETTCKLSRSKTSPSVYVNHTNSPTVQSHILIKLTT